MKVKLIFSRNFDKEYGFRVRDEFENSISDYRRSSYDVINRMKFYSTRILVVDYKLQILRDLCTFRDPRQHHENFKSNRYENHYLLPVERRWTINSGDRGGTGLVLAYSTIESAIEQLGVR